MNRSKSFATAAALLVAALVQLAAVPPALAQTTPFIYQGRLWMDGAPVNGPANMRFRLYDSPDPGASQIGAEDPHDLVPVSDGLFTVDLDFSEPTAFDGINEHWLEIEIQAAGQPAFVLLDPRQQVNAAPKAMVAEKAQLLVLPFDQIASLAGVAFRVSNVGPAIEGFSQNGPGVQAYGVDGTGVYGRNKFGSGIGTLGTAHGVWGDSFSGNGVLGTSNSGAGVRGVSNGGVNKGVIGVADAADGVGVEGASAAGTGVNGVSTSGFGVRGVSDTFPGVSGQSISNWGVQGISETSIGVQGQSTSGYGVQGVSGNTYGVRGDSTSGIGVGGISSSTYGVYGGSTSSIGVRGDSSSYIGVSGYASAGTGMTFGGYFQSASTSGRGLVGLASAGSGTTYGVLGNASSPSGFGVYSAGNCHVSGTLTATTKQFKIDHPLDPANRYLVHNCVESPDMMNIYNGNAVTDAQGYATITLPDWFEALNRDFRYQLTVLDEQDAATFVQAKVVRKVRDGQFTIRTSAPRAEVSWQVTGIRHDPWAEAHRSPVEQDKPENQRGKYLNPIEHGQPIELGIDHAITLETAAALEVTPADEAESIPADSDSNE